MLVILHLLLYYRKARSRYTNPQIYESVYKFSFEILVLKIDMVTLV